MLLLLLSLQPHELVSCFTIPFLQRTFPFHFLFQLRLEGLLPTHNIAALKCLHRFKDFLLDRLVVSGLGQF